MNALSGALDGQQIDKDWWRGAVIYQIYPRSFQDTDGNGVGDLKGITRRLPYVAELGADAIWISPFFTSPMKDFGYDVSDYTNVDASFGTLDDFQELVQTAHKLNVKVMIDQVISHSSDQHPWFEESRQSRDNPRSDWYVWADPKPDGTPPNNWLSIFGGPAWQWDARREQYYLHNFLVSQPDLNFHNAAVQDALLEAVRFWLDLGVDGFRLDTINFYFHDDELRDNPPLPREERNATIAPSVNPYNHQNHLFDKNRPENLEFLKRFRDLLDQYPAATCVGEVGDAQRGLDIVGEYTSGDDKVHMCYAFELLAKAPLSADYVARVMDAFETKAPEGWACWAMSNHDVQRHVSRWEDIAVDHDQFARFSMALLMSLRGSVCIYQGEELGLPEADVSFDELQDPYGIEFWPEFKGRDGCRTPMIWEDGPNGGFSEANKTWLPVSPTHVSRSPAVQMVDPGSVYTTYKNFIKFRNELAPLVKGTITVLDTAHDVLAFLRTWENETVLCVFNFNRDEAAWDASQFATAMTALKGHGFNSWHEGHIVHLPAQTAFYATIGNSH
jgi:alpha-glucosidase